MTTDEQAARALEQIATETEVQIDLLTREILGPPD
jgi:hypothetical protein